jgi:hypothetical protein
LGDEAVPGIVAAYAQLPVDARRAVNAFLEERRDALRADPSVRGWPAWNLTRARARAALEGWTPTS